MITATAALLESLVLEMQLVVRELSLVLEIQLVLSDCPIFLCAGKNKSATPTHPSMW
jgi:hypothetical protein